ncbi:MAG: mediator of RNA polymerase II transcription subunit 8 [Watsoniomyces obsoletus]|nr:MAG: mediator of RNA polymerase II transcription subunit 8 [Watsoniomyces obsoletus]
MAEPRYKLIFTVPHAHLENVKDAVFAVGAGTFPGGKYTRVCFQMPGIGEFQPEVEKGAKPFVGTLGVLERVEEMRVEILCVGNDVMKEAVKALKRAHPYEEPAYEVYKMEDV